MNPPGTCHSSPESGADPIESSRCGWRPRGETAATMTRRLWLKPIFVIPGAICGWGVDKGCAGHALTKLADADDLSFKLTSGYVPSDSGPSLFNLYPGQQAGTVEFQMYWGSCLVDQFGRNLGCTDDLPPPLTRSRNHWMMSGSRRVVIRSMAVLMIAPRWLWEKSYSSRMVQP
jgi:hypothetical protein